MIASCPIGESADDPMLESTLFWISSPSTVLENFVIAKNVPADKFPKYSRAINLPGFTVSVKEQVEASRKVAGDEAVALIKFEKDEVSERVVRSLPAKFDNEFACRLGFKYEGVSGVFGCSEEGGGGGRKRWSNRQHASLQEMSYLYKIVSISSIGEPFSLVPGCRIRLTERDSSIDTVPVCGFL